MTLAQKPDYDELKRVALAHNDLLKILDQSIAKALNIWHLDPLLRAGVALFYRAIEGQSAARSFVYNAAKRPRSSMDRVTDFESGG